MHTHVSIGLGAGEEEEEGDKGKYKQKAKARKRYTMDHTVVHDGHGPFSSVVVTAALLHVLYTKASSGPREMHFSALISALGRALGWQYGIAYTRPCAVGL